MEITEEILLSKGFTKEIDHGIVNFELKLSEETILVITPQLNEIFVWHTLEEIRVYIQSESIDTLIQIAKSITGIEV